MRLKLFFGLIVSFALSAVFANGGFGPYLTYSGLAGNGTERITVHIGRMIGDSADYYVAYWKEGGTIELREMNTSKVIHCKSGELHCDSMGFQRTKNPNLHSECDTSRYPKYIVYSATLDGLDSATVYKYMVGRGIGGLAGYTYTDIDTVRATDVADAGGKLLVNSALLSGSFWRVKGKLAYRGELKRSVHSVFTKFSLSVSSVPRADIYSFLVPDSDAQQLTCFLTADTQFAKKRKEVYYSNMQSLINTSHLPTMILHCGDMHDSMTENISERFVRNTSLSPDSAFSYYQRKQMHTSLFCHMPLQVAEGNHDLGFSFNYSAKGIVASDDDIALTKKQYTEEMIWFDKLFHHDYPGLSTPVTVLEDGVAKPVKDYYSSYYSFDYGPVHFAMLDMDNMFPVTNVKDTGYVGKQLRWLADDLSATNKKFKVVVSHSYTASFNSQIYTIPFNYGGVFTDTIARSSNHILEAIVIKNGVCAFLSGHLHCQGSWDKVRLERSRSVGGEKQFLWFNIGDSALYNESFYTLSFDEVSETMYYTKYGPDNFGRKSSEYVLDSLHTIKKLEK